jgi:hypothetical protein
VAMAGLWRRFMLLRCAKRYSAKPAEGRSAHPATRGLPAVAPWPPDDVDARRDLHPLAAVLLSIRWGSLVGFAVRFLSAGVPGHVACKPEGL